MEESDKITLKIRNPNNEDMINLTVPKSALISEVKQTICERLPNNPLPKTQKLIYRGRLCKDESTVKEILPSDFVDKEIFMHIIIPQPVVKPVIHQPVQAPPKLETPSSIPIPSPKTQETLSPTQSVSSTIPNPPSSAQSPLEYPQPPPPTQNLDSSPQVSSLSMNSYTSTPTTANTPITPSPFSPEQIDYMNQAITYYQQYLTQYQNYLASLSGNNNNNQSLHNSHQRNSPVDEIHRLEQEDAQNQQQQQNQNRIIHRIRLVFDIKMIIQLTIFGCIFGQGYQKKGKIIISLLCLFLYLLKTGMLDPMKYFLNSNRGTIRQDESSFYDYIIPFLSFFLSLYPGWNAEPIPLPENPNDANQQQRQQQQQQENNNNNEQQPIEEQQQINNNLQQQQQQQVNENGNNSNNSSDQPHVSLHNDNDNNQPQQIIDDKKEK